MDFLGINVGKRDLHMVLLQDNQRAAKTVPNSPAGFAQLGAWLKNREALLVHACLESTGGWSGAVARSLHLAGHIVRHVVNAESNQSIQCKARCCGLRPTPSTQRPLPVFAGCTVPIRGRLLRRKPLLYKG